MTDYQGLAALVAAATILLIGGLIMGWALREWRDVREAYQQGLKLGTHLRDTDTPWGVG